MQSLSARCSAPRCGGDGTVKIIKTFIYKGAGHLLVAVGILGIFLPLLPTTIFWILATGCYAKSAPHLRDRILNHPRFGTAISNWLEFRVIERRPKIYAITGIVVGFAISALGMPSEILMIVGFPMLGLIAYLATRPEQCTTALEKVGRTDQSGQLNSL